jgi:excisionase family DNA binding protein
LSFTDSIYYSAAMAKNDRKRGGVEEHLSLAEAAERMGISERTARRWIKSGKLRAYKPGRDYWIPESALTDLIEESEVHPKAPASSQPDFNELLEEEQRRTELEEVRESFLEDCAPAGDYIMRWERWLDTGGIPEEAVREFLVAATALYPALLGLLRDELTAIVRVLGIKVVDELPDEAKAESAILPLVNRYWELGHKLTDVWNERFPEKENIVDLEAMRREPRLRRAG